MKLIIENWKRFINETIDDPGILKGAPETQEDLDTVFKILELASLEGFSGACAEAAIAINNVLFDGEGTLVAAVNKHLWTKDKRMVGHVAVFFEPDGSYWDTEGEKEWEEIESWGMLEPEDPDYNFNTEDEAYETVRLEPTEEELIEYFGGCLYPKMVRQLNNAKLKVLENKLKNFARRP